MKPRSHDINPSLTFRSSHSVSLQLSLLICFPECLFFFFASAFSFKLCLSLSSYCLYGFGLFEDPASGQRSMCDDPHMQEAEILKGSLDS